MVVNLVRLLDDGASRVLRLHQLFWCSYLVYARKHPSQCGNRGGEGIHGGLSLGSRMQWNVELRSSACNGASLHHFMACIRAFAYHVISRRGMERRMLGFQQGVNTVAAERRITDYQHATDNLHDSMACIRAFANNLLRRGKCKEGHRVFSRVCTRLQRNIELWRSSACISSSIHSMHEGIFLSGSRWGRNGGKVALFSAYFQEFNPSRSSMQTSLTTAKSSLTFNRSSRRYP